MIHNVRNKYTYNLFQLRTAFRAFLEVKPLEPKHLDHSRNNLEKSYLYLCLFQLHVTKCNSRDQLQLSKIALFSTENLASPLFSDCHI